MALSDEQLMELLTDVESDRVERTVSKNDKDKFSEAICAFANDLPGHGKPGVLFVGARDNGQPSGLPITDELLRTLAALRDQGNLLPPPSMVVRKVSLTGIDMAVVEVQSAAAPPVRYQGRIYIRIGPRRGIANKDDERRLNERRRALDLPFDARPINGPTMADLDLRLFEITLLSALYPAEVLAENDRTTEQRLTALRLLTTDRVPTAAGLLTLGRDPLFWLPGAYVQFLRIDGTDLTEPIIDTKRIDGPLVDLLRQLDELLELNIKIAVDITAGRRDERTPDYPLVALQQVARNAIMHRSYENTNAPVRITWYHDRVEITSPGGPYGNVTPENFGDPGVTDCRNPGIADIMHGLGYVQRFGAGIHLTRRALAGNGNPEPEFKPEPSYVSVIVRRRP